MRVEKNVPEIRFEGFSGEWEERLLGSLCLIGDIDHRMPESKTTGIPYLMTGDFYGINGLDFSRAKLISIEDYEQLSKKIKPEFGDILFARYASVGAVRYVETDTKFLISYSCAILKTNNTTYGKYLFYFFQTERTQGQLELDINTGSQRNIGIDSLKSLLVVLPKPAEQTAIGNTFQKLDNLINQHQQKHDKLSNIKKAMLEKMFPKQGETIPEIRFKGFSGEWKEVSLSDFGVATSGTSIESEFTKDGKYKVISIGSYSENSVYTEQGIRASLSPKTESRVLNKNDLTMILNDKTLAGNIIGRVLLVDEDDSYVYNQRTQRIEPSSEYNPQFLYQFLNAPSVRKRIFKASQGNTQIYVNWSAISKLKYFIPKKDEQTAIGNYFQKLDALINQHQQQITKLNNIKQACLSKMFV